MNPIKTATDLLRQSLPIFRSQKQAIGKLDLKGAGDFAYNPGSYAAENSALLEQTEFYLLMEKLWIAEAEEATHPARRLGCLELAKAYRSVYDLQHDWYSRWQLAGGPLKDQESREVQAKVLRDAANLAESGG